MLFLQKQLGQCNLALENGARITITYNTSLSKTQYSKSLLGVSVSFHSVSVSIPLLFISENLYFLCSYCISNVLSPTLCLLPIWVIAEVKLQLFEKYVPCLWHEAQYWVGQWDQCDPLPWVLPTTAFSGEGQSWRMLRVIGNKMNHCHCEGLYTQGETEWRRCWVFFFYSILGYCMCVWKLQLHSWVSDHFPVHLLIQKCILIDHNNLIMASIKIHWLLSEMACKVRAYRLI